MTDTKRKMTDFLLELAGLLEKYNADIEAIQEYIDGALYVEFGVWPEYKAQRGVVNSETLRNLVNPI